MKSIQLRLLSERAAAFFGKDKEVQPELVDFWNDHPDQERIALEDTLDVLRNAASLSRLALKESVSSTEQLQSLCNLPDYPVVFYSKNREGFIWVERKKKGYVIANFERGEELESQGYACAELPVEDFYQENGRFPILLYAPMEPLFAQVGNAKKDLTSKPIRRFFRMMHQERKEVMLLYVYALLHGLATLSLPLGIQAIISLLMGAQISTSLVLLISLVLLGVLITGGLQIMQLWIVEAMQQRLFARASFEFAWRIPRMRLDKLEDQYTPELVNRFFDILTVQKGLPKLLIELTGAGLQILFGMILLAFYHWTFVFFGIFLSLVLYIIFRVTSPKAMEASLKESTYKYKTAHWLEEIGRNLNLFKLTGNSSLPLEKTDKLVGDYIHFRRKKFRVIISQNWYVVMFKMLITAGLLILGGSLVVDQQINIGQFVAGEIVIILIINSVEKIIQGLESIYEVLTGTEKLGLFTDYPLEIQSGRRLTGLIGKEGLQVEARDVKFNSSLCGSPVLNGVSFKLNRSEKVCITGLEGSGKSTILSIVTGLRKPASGKVIMEGIPLENLDALDVHTLIGENFLENDVFYGTVLENISLGRPYIGFTEVAKAADLVGLTPIIQNLKHGFDTLLIPEKKGLSSTMIQKINLARCLVDNPKLLLLDEFLGTLDSEEQEAIIDLLIHKMPETTLLAVSRDLAFAEKCDRIIILKDGKVFADDSPANLKSLGLLHPFLH